MDPLLTTRQVQELLNVDRTTVYRMLEDGRLRGVKVGQQWRIRRGEVERLLRVREPLPGEPSEVVIPPTCAQPIQDVFAELAEVSVITVDADGRPITRMSNPTRFCTLMLDTESGAAACRAAWASVVDRGSGGFVTCHAGLQCGGAAIELGGRAVAAVVACQFFASEGDRAADDVDVEALAARHGIDAGALVAARQAVPVLGEGKLARLEGWLRRMAETFQHVARERAEFMGRLRGIAELTELGS